MTIGTRLFTWLNGELVDSDRFGNRYYRERRRPRNRRQRRWVIYQGEAEASKVPTEWHVWLHHTSDDPPTDAHEPTRPWQKEHVPNLTGTDAAYRPPGSILQGGERARGTGDYEPWRPS